MSPELQTALTLSKAKLGISSTVRDEYLTAIIEGVVQELNDTQGIPVDLENSIHLMYVVDFAVYRYENRDDSSLPINLLRRLHNLIISDRSV